MGILYNRFTPEPPPFLIPYSNRSNILAYLVPSSFKGSSSTVWGDDYPVPMVMSDRFSEWQYNSDNSINLHGIFGINLPNYGIDPISKYTVYLVARYNQIKASGASGYEPWFCLNNRNYDKKQDRIFEAYGVQIRARLITVSDVYNESVLTPVGSPYGYYHAYAFRYVSGKYAHVIDDQNLVTISTSNYNARFTRAFTFENILELNLGRDDNSVDVKFISIVSGEESDSTILSNVSNIVRKLNLP